MDVGREQVGTTAGHDAQGPAPVHAYTLDAGPALSVTVWTYGASLIEVVVPGRNGQRDNVVVRLPDLAAYESGTAYLGATVGRYARCIAGGRFVLDGRVHEVVRNDGRHHFHGGVTGFDRFVWQADAGVAADHVAVTLRLERPDGDQGYPGAVSVETVYRAYPDGRLSFEHRATTTMPTVVDITNHSFWNLAGRGTIDGHRLRVGGDRYLPVDDELLPVGMPVPVGGTPYDFTASRPIGDLGLDHCFALEPSNDAATAAVLFDDTTGRSMTIDTDQPGLQVYSGDGLRPLARAGIALQTGSWPDAPNRPEYPSVRLDPGEVYVHRTTHRFSSG